MLQPFKYEGFGYQNPGVINYPSQQPQQEQQSSNLGGLTDLFGQFQETGGMNMFSSAGGGEAALASGGSGSMGPVAELAAAESTAGIGAAEGGGGWMSSAFGGGAGASGGGAGASGSSSGMSAAMSNPWTALAAVIIGNELYATQKEGNRDKNGFGYIQDLGSGNVLNQDVSGRYLPAIGIDEGTTANKWLSGLSNPAGWAAGKIKDWF